MKRFFKIAVFFSLLRPLHAQDTLTLRQIITNINQNNRQLQQFEATARSEQEAAKGAFTWMPPEVGAGLWMTPYNPKYLKGENGMGGMGQYMVSVQQMLPNRKLQNAEYNYMNSMSNITKERSEAAQNNLNAQAKKNFYAWMVIKKKLAVLADAEKLVELMIKTAEIRYRNNTGDITAYYKAKAALGNIETARVQLQNEITQRRISLNALMHRDKTFDFAIDTSYVLKDFTTAIIDSAALINSRSDIAAAANEVRLTNLQQNVENQKLNPEFGLRFDHMMGIGNMPAQFTLMGMVRIPFAKWSSKGVKANVESLKWRAVAQEREREALINEALSEAYATRAELIARQKQVRLFEQEIIPAFRRNYQTTQLAYEQNTEKLFVLYDAWEQYNKIQMEYLDQLQQLLVLQAEMERILEIKE